MDRDNHKCVPARPSGGLFKPCPYCKGRWMFLKDWEIRDDIARLIESSLKEKK